MALCVRQHSVRIRRAKAVASLSRTRHLQTAVLSILVASCAAKMFAALCWNRPSLAHGTHAQSIACKLKCCGVRAIRNVAVEPKLGRVILRIMSRLVARHALLPLSQLVATTSPALSTASTRHLMSGVRAHQLAAADCAVVTAVSPLNLHTVV